MEERLLFEKYEEVQGGKKGNSQKDMCKGSTSLNLKLKSVITFVIVSVDDILHISSPDIIAT